MNDRATALQSWVRGLFPGVAPELTPASEDASFRRYLRLRVDGRSLIVMDAPPEHEDCRPFIDVARRLDAAGVHVPAIYEADVEQGFLLLSDLGDTAYFDVIRQGNGPVEALYRDALGTLVRMQARTELRGLPVYDECRLRAEMELFPEWFLSRHLGQPASPAQRRVLDQVFDQLVGACLEQPQVFVHRDYHCRNLMVVATPQGCAGPNPGVIDFQDAVVGPLTYDLISLCRDVYVDWPQSLVVNWMERFRGGVLEAGICTRLPAEDLSRWFNLTATQRLLKVAGIFARLCYRDGKARYLRDLPLVLSHLRGAASAAGEELVALGRLLDTLPIGPDMVKPRGCTQPGNRPG